MKPKQKKKKPKTNPHLKLFFSLYFCWFDCDAIDLDVFFLLLADWCFKSLNHANGNTFCAKKKQQRLIRNAFIGNNICDLVFNVFLSYWTTQCVWWISSLVHS